MSVSQNIQESEEKDVFQTQNNTNADKCPAKRNTVVTFAPGHTSISFNEAREPSCLTNIKQDKFVSKENCDIDRHSSNVHLSQSNISNKSNKFAQTFFKSMMNLSNRRFVEIINMSVNHDDKCLVFYRRSDELLPDEKKSR